MLAVAVAVRAVQFCTPGPQQQIRRIGDVRRPDDGTDGHKDRRTAVHRSHSAYYASSVKNATVTDNL